MKSTVLFLSAILLSCSLLSAATVNKPSVFTEIDKTPFGNTMLNLMHIHMQMEHPIDEISSYLQQIKSSLETSQTSADDEHKAERTACDTDLSTFDNIIETNKNLRDVAQGQVESLTKTLSEKNDLLKTEEADLQTNQNLLKGENQANEAAVAAFTKSKADLEDAISACGEALDLLARLNTSPSMFIQLSGQVSNKLEKIKEKLSKHLPSYLAIYSPIIDALTQIKNKADPTAVKQVEELIVKLKTELEAHLASLIANEKTRVTNYENAVANLNTLITNGGDRINQLNSDITQATTQKALEEGKVVSYSTLVTENESLRNIRQKQCDDEQASYDNDFNTRKNELEILGRLIKHFQDKIENFNDFLRERTATF